MTIPLEKKQQPHHWQNQNRFLQDRHGRKKVTSPEIMAVGLPVDDDGFDLLSWTINMAARPGDSVVALHLRNCDTTQRCKAVITYKPEVFDARFKPLQDLCDVKQVQLEVRLAVNETAEKVLVDEASAMGATMLVVSASGHHVLRHAQKRGTFLTRHVPAGCSVVVVKDYKILFYKENSFRASVPTLFDEDIQHRRSGQTYKGLEKQSAPKCGSFNIQLSGPSPTVREVETLCELDSSFIPCDKVWPDCTGTCSPRRVLDGPSISSESDESPTSSVYSGLSRSLSRKALISCTSSHGDDDSFIIKKPRSCLSIWKRGPMLRSQTFPSVSLFKKLSISFHYRSLGNSLKLYINNMRSMRALKRGGTCTPGALSESKMSWKSFTFDEILSATNYFSPGNLVGNGGYAEVYKGILPNGQLVAVKRLIRGDTEEDKVRDFLTELGIICHINHPNTTPLVGFCIEKGLHLVFHFSQQGNLASWLHGEKSSPLQWPLRYKVAVGTARGLNYLHTGCQRRIIHRDIKASNILLGIDFEPQISDFGLAKWLPDQCTHHILTPIEGTFGYLAPEYFMHGIVDEKTDVFAFGILLLELITGRKPIETSQPSLVIWAKPFLESLNYEELADAQLYGAYDPQEMQCMTMAAALCTQQSPLCRPSMSQVLQLLVDELNSETADSWSMVSSQSFFFQDSIFDGDYSCTNYRNDLLRHQEIALQF